MLQLCNTETTDLISVNVEFIQSKRLIKKSFIGWIDDQVKGRPILHNNRVERAEVEE